jgi:hypothetical protein
MSEQFVRLIRVRLNRERRTVVEARKEPKKHKLPPLASGYGHDRFALGERAHYQSAAPP